MRFRLISLLIAIAIIASLLAFARNCLTDPAFRYRVLGDRHAFRGALANEIENGDPIEHVSMILGNGVHRKEKPWVEIQMLSTDTVDFDMRYPDGIKIEDMFIAYRDFPNQYVLQFRNGRVINLNTQWLRQHYGEHRRSSPEPFSAPDRL